MMSHSAYRGLLNLDVRITERGESFPSFRFNLREILGLCCCQAQCERRDAMPTKLERLIEKESQLKAQIQPPSPAERTLEKKRDTRRKILIGAAVLARVNSGEWQRQELTTMMDGFLSRPHERELFGLDGDGAADETEAQAEALKKTASGTKTKVKPKQPVKPLPESDGDVDDEFDL